MKLGLTPVLVVLVTELHAEFAPDGGPPFIQIVVEQSGDKRPGVLELLENILHSEGAFECDVAGLHDELRNGELAEDLERWHYLVWPLRAQVLVVLLDAWDPSAPRNRCISVTGPTILLAPGCCLSITPLTPFDDPLYLIGHRRLQVCNV